MAMSLRPDQFLLEEHRIKEALVLVRELRDKVPIEPSILKVLRLVELRLELFGEIRDDSDVERIFGDGFKGLSWKRLIDSAESLVSVLEREMDVSPGCLPREVEACHLVDLAIGIRAAVSDGFWIFELKRKRARGKEN